MADEVTINPKEEALQTLQTQLTQLQNQVYGFTEKLDQSRVQAEQLAQRNTVVMGEVRRLETVLDDTPRAAIQEAYAEALESQQRLLTIRGQMEKLQGQESVIRGEIGRTQALIQTLSQAEAEEEEERFNARETIIRVMDAQEDERERLSRQMHDGPAHALTNFIIQAEICQKAFDRDPERSRQELRNLKASAGDAFQHVRDFIFDLRPMMLTDLGVVPTVKRYLDAFENNTGIKTEFNLMGHERRLEGYQEMMLFRGIQEFVVNARDHGGGDSVKVTLELGETVARVVVEDDGRGFTTEKLEKSSSKHSKTLGLSTMRERCALVNGSLVIDSSSGQGAIIEMTIPVGPEASLEGEFTEYVN